MMTKLEELAVVGQSIWLDNIRRTFITGGGLQALIDKGLRGMTSNPSIFEKAISKSNDYDEDIRELKKEGLSVEEIYENLAMKDITMAADLLLPVYRATGGLDGYVSMEVNPKLAYDTQGTVDEARRLFDGLGRENVMIKIPATEQGLPAITTSIAAGININVTLIFSVENYRRVAEAYLEGLEQLTRNGGDPGGVASVASFFVSRIDTAVDKELESIEEKSLQGKIAIANSKKARKIFHELIGSDRWKVLEGAGARVQRLLWASTSTKNPDYPDTLYVDNLIGSDTVNTLPQETLDDFMDHGKVSLSLDTGIDEALVRLEHLRDLQIDLNRITDQLQKDGVEAFAKSFDELLKAIDGQ